MKQLVQHIRSGQSLVTEVPAPGAGPGQVLVNVAFSLVSAGTERMVIEFAEKTLLGKAVARPDLARQALDKARCEGILTAFDAVRNRLDQPMALGYSLAGTVIDAGPGVHGFAAGDRIAAAGGGHAVHAEVVNIPVNLAIKLPEGVEIESAAFTTLGAIALQALRLCDAKLGESVAVIGLGLVGQLTVQLSRAAGCRVLGMDLNPERARRALASGAEAVATSSNDFAALCRARSAGHGVDAVIIAADTESNEPVALAGQIARDKGVVVAAGAVGTTIPRKVYYEKELDFRISRSYGPGRYDPEYEEKGRDYPYGYVRWTEQRNMQAFVQLLAEGRLDVRSLITHRIPIESGVKAYEIIKGKTNEPFLGVLLTYAGAPDRARKIVLRHGPPASGESRRVPQVNLGVLGAGNFANSTLLPVIKGLPGVRLEGVVSARGLSARHTADRFGFAYCATDEQRVLSEPGINTAVILTRHHLHARQVIAALRAGKHVFVEKPLCLTRAELLEIVRAYEAAADSNASARPVVMVGYNRRFAPFVLELKQKLRGVQEGLMLHYRVNAGFIPANHWTQDPAEGGGRLLGEACHFIDLLIFLAGDAVRKVSTRALPDSGRYSRDNLSVALEFANGSLGTVTYVANGDKGFGKECLEVFGGGLSARLDDYRNLSIRYGSKRVNRTARLRQDKGHRAEWQAFVACLTGQGPVPIPFEEIVQSTEATLAAQDSLERGSAVTLGNDQ